MRVALFFDGKNFYHGLKEFQTENRIDFLRLADWLREKVKGSTIVGSHYYTGVETPGQELPASAGNLERFLKVIEAQRGFYVHRFPRRKQVDVCRRCGTEVHYTQEKQVDTSIVADMVKGAAIDAYDIAVLLSGDADFVPAIEVVNSLGKQVYVGTWNGVGQADRMRSVAYDIINLASGVEFFKEGGRAAREPRLSHAQGNPTATKEVVEVDEETREAQEAADREMFLTQLDKAGEHFGQTRDGNLEPGFIGLGFFLTKWQADGFQLDADFRKEVMQELIEMKEIEIYDSGKGSMAIRRYQAPEDEFNIHAEWEEESADAS